MSSGREPRPSTPALRLATAALMMDEFLSDTGLSSPLPPRRYLWTDAFAVCNCLTLYRRTGDQTWLRHALDLIDQVHHVLGRHRPDDVRTGWLSGLGDREGELRPTAGGLRIGKPLPERGPGEPADPQLEWEQDGQYFHYLTRWMHALGRAAAVTGELRYRDQAVELARVAHRAFVRGNASGGRRMVWKMSVDLSRPLVESMGQHDPLDGLITFAALQSEPAELATEIGELREMCEGKRWATDDALGAGGLLVDVYRVMQIGPRAPLPPDLLPQLFRDGVASLEAVLAGRSLEQPVSRRLAFRELGLAIGLTAVEMLTEGGSSGSAPHDAAIIRRAHALQRFAELRRSIESTWLDPRARASPTWTDHFEINCVMLATSLAPDEYLRVGPD
jgi:hypothetical protein